MRIHRFCLPSTDLAVPHVRVTDAELLHQWLRVLRFEPGSVVRLFDGAGAEVTATVDALSAREAVLTVTERLPARSLSARAVTLGMAVVRKELMSWALEKVTELGASRFVPVRAARQEREVMKMDRMQRIAREACEQSGRTVLLAVEPVMSWQDCVRAALERGDEVWFAHFGGEPARGVRVAPGKGVTVLIGPEGGWLPEEVDDALALGVRVVSLGENVLRAETAAIIGVYSALA